MKRKPWEFYLDLKYRSLYKNKYLKGRGLTASQTAEIMRKFKVYIDRINQSPISVRVRSAESVIQLVYILNGVFNNEWKNYIKDSYKDMPYYFYDYAKFVDLIIDCSEMLVSKTKLKDLYWPDGSPIKIEDFSKATKAKHNHIKLTINGISKTYPGTNALITICNHIGIIKVAEINLTTNGLKLLVKHIPMGKENKYMEMGNGWFICTSCDTKVKLRLIKIITIHFHQNVNAELV